MTAIKLDGLAAASAIKAELAKQVVELKQRGVNPGLGTLLVGDDPGSHKYVAGKHRDCAEIGMHSVRIDMKASSSAADIRAAIRDLNDAGRCAGQRRSQFARNSEHQTAEVNRVQTIGVFCRVDELEHLVCANANRQRQLDDVTGHVTRIV